MSRIDELRRNLEAVQERIAVAERAAGRPAGSVRLLPVTKFHPAADVAFLQQLGVTDVAENREQEARDKALELPAMNIHMIGQIQTKKANSVARWAAAIHSVDSIKLADALDRGIALALERGDRTDDQIPCLIQLSLDGDVSRGGVAADGVEKLATVMEESRHLHLAGLMCVPPRGWEAKVAFGQAAAVVGALADQFGRPMEFSAGMTGDLTEAIACGSTIVRVGTAIMGPRPVA